MYGFTEGEPFKVYARRDSTADALVLKFECNEGMGVLGIRKLGRADPLPSAAYQEEDIEPASLRAGRFVHVLPSGQRQSYALSRISPEFALRLPSDRWVELRPHTEYGFRYLIAPEEQLQQPVKAAAAVAVATPAPLAPQAPAAPGPQPGKTPVPTSAPAPAPANDTPTPAIEPVERPAPVARLPSLPPGTIPQTTAMSPPIAEAALKGLSKEQAVEHLRTEMSKVNALLQKVGELDEALRKSRSRERDLLEVLSKWQQH